MPTTLVTDWRQLADRSVDGLVPATYVGAAAVAAGALAALAVPRRGPRPRTTGAALAASA